jgi:hypothetical protein
MRYSCKEPRQLRPFHPYREGSPSSRAAQVIWSAGQAVRKSITVDERRPFLAEELTYIPLRRCSPNMPILNTIWPSVRTPGEDVVTATWARFPLGVGGGCFCALATTTLHLYSETGSTYTVALPFKVRPRPVGSPAVACDTPRWY